MSPQCQLVIDYLTRHGSITPLEALNALGINRLGARIWDLKREGFGIVTELVEVPTRFGTAKVARYSIGSSAPADRGDSQSAPSYASEDQPALRFYAGQA